MLMALSETSDAGEEWWDCAMKAHAFVYNISASLKLFSWKYLKYAISIRRKYKAIPSDLFPSSLRRVALLDIMRCIWITALDSVEGGLSSWLLKG